MSNKLSVKELLAKANEPKEFAMKYYMLIGYFSTIFLPF